MKANNHHNPLVVAALNAATGARSTTLAPSRLFVAWSGVLTLAFTGFPPSLAAVKARLEGLAVSGGLLPPESPGSKWPKTTLAAMRDDAPPMTMRELKELRDLCGRYDAVVVAAGPTTPVHRLSVVDYRSRSLEDVAGTINVPLEDPAAGEQPSEAERERVASVLSEWDDDMGGYLEKVNMPGSRAASYHEESPRGSTLVAFWGNDAEGNARLMDALECFRRDVDALLPGRYRWHDFSSLHCTLRSLGPAFVCQETALGSA